MGQGGGECLSESGVVRLFAGALDVAERGQLAGHLGHCDRCARLIGEAARDTGSSGGGRLGDGLRPVVLSPGMVIASRYHVRRLLGTGAMGEVHEVDDRLLGSVVALKTLNAKLAGDEKALARLKREVAAARRVTHANVCRIFDLGVDHGDPALGALVFLTMEYLPGVTLARHLRAHGGFPAAAALPLLVQLADAMAAAHAAGIIHRDLKAENVMLVEQADGALRPVITDFGLAGFALQDEAGLERGSGFSGTLAYAAPERIAGGRATAASDVYSFGLIAVEVLTGRPPAIADAASGGGPPIAGLPDGWASVLARTLELDPSARLQTGGAAAAALRALSEPGVRRAATGRARSIATTAIVAAIAAASAIWVAGGGPRSIDVSAPRQTQAAPATVSAREVVDFIAAEPNRGDGDVIARPTQDEPTRRGPPARGPARKARRAPETAAPPAPAPSWSAPPAASKEAAATPVDDLVRDLRFRARAGPAEGSATRASELVDPFERRRAGAAGAER
jgi:serine/threonine protein kinase